MAGRRRRAEVVVAEAGRQVAAGRHVLDAHALGDVEGPPLEGVVLDAALRPRPLERHVRRVDHRCHVQHRVWAWMRVRVSEINREKLIDVGFFSSDFMGT